METVKSVNDFKDIRKLSNQFNIRRGDIFYIKSPINAIGSEQKNTRPAIIVQNDDGNEFSPTVEIVYLTKEEKNNLPTHTQVNSLSKPSTSLCEQITTVSKDRLLEYIGHVSNEELVCLEKAMMISVGINYESKVDKYSNYENELIIAAEKKKSEISDIQRRLIDFERLAVLPIVNDNLLKILNSDSVERLSLIGKELIEADRKKIETELKKAIGGFTEEKATPQAEEPIKRDTKVGEPKKQEKPSKKKELDIEKILALKKAGWKVKDIADELGVTAQTISNALFKHKKEQESVGACVC